MFDFLRSKDGKARQAAHHWLELAERVYHFRRDQIPAAQLQDLESARAALKAQVKARAGASVLTPAIEHLEQTMRACGGRIYPTNSLVENVEFFLVAAIVILGLRAYFVQPFKIPTNSMLPSYYGMTAESFPPGEGPGPLARAFRFATLGARNYSVVAPADGAVMVRVFRDARAAFSEQSGRSMLVFPAVLHEYAFSVGGQVATLKIPKEFEGEFTTVLDREFGAENGRLKTAAGRSQGESSILRVRGGSDPLDARVYWIPTGRTVRKGEAILSFDILTGDLLFVDRVSYNFVPPSVGSGFVFKTGHIDSPEMQDPSSGRQIQQYYIKRLVGVPGDTIEIRRPDSAPADGNAKPLGPRDGQLYRNDAPITGAAAFGKNARREGLYPGYIADGNLGFGEVVEVPEHFYYALGDNSPRSKDSRFWGFVPEKDVVGRPLFIYYPLTKRWGPAR
jgi:signal peptidase I